MIGIGRMGRPDRETGTVGDAEQIDVVPTSNGSDRARVVHAPVLDQRAVAGLNPDADPRAEIPHVEEGLPHEEQVPVVGQRRGPDRRGAEQVERRVVAEADAGIAQVSAKNTTLLRERPAQAGGCAARGARLRPCRAVDAARRPIHRLEIGRVDAHAVADAVALKAVRRGGTLSRSAGALASARTPKRSCDLRRGTRAGMVVRHGRRVVEVDRRRAATGDACASRHPHIARGRQRVAVGQRHEDVAQPELA